MAAAFVQLPLVRMVDLTISPTEGVVNFHLLQALLHALVQKSHAQSVAVEIHGAEAVKLQELLKVASEKPAYTIKETIDKSAQGKDQEIYVMHPETAYQGSSSVSKEKMDGLEAEVNDLKKQIVELRDLPGNLGIIEAVKNFDEKSSTVIDVFHMLSLQKRIEAAEEGMVKIASIVEDLIKSPGAIGLDTKNVVCQKEDGADVAGGAAGSVPAEGGKEGGSAVAISGTVTARASVHSAGNVGAVGDKKSVQSIKKSSRSVAEGDTDGLLKQLVRDVDEIQIRLKMKRRSLETISGGMGEEMGGEETDHIHDYDVGMGDERLKEVTEHVDRLDLSLNEEITRLHNQFTDIEKDFNELLNKIEAGATTGDGNEPNACCSAVYQKLVQLEENFADLNETSCTLLNDREEKTKLLEFLVEQTEVLKSVKADREELAEALADKADACAVLRKVSHDQFDNACEELSKGVGEALEKLGQQELLWQQALDDIQNEIGNKLDKMDLGPLREFINNKLRLLQDKMKSLAALKREQDAAGTKNKLLRDVTCLSCDKDVVMQKEFDMSMRPLGAVVPPHRSMAPYLAYELDALRKQQKAVPGGKNLHSFEAAMQGRAQKRADDHICNRYCGGSHTITTPHQRVTRLGHFLMQWGPEAQPVPTSDKRSSTQRVSASEKPPELTGSAAKIASKVDQSKRVSKTSQGRVSKTQAIGEEPKRLSIEAKKKLMSTTGSIIEKKISAISMNGSSLRVRDPSRISKAKQVTIPDDSDTAPADDEGQGQPPPEAIAEEYALAAEEAPAPAEDGPSAPETEAETEDGAPAPPDDE